MSFSASELASRNFTILSEHDLLLSGLRLEILKHCYRPEVLPPVGDTRGPVKDRYRAKDMCIYRRRGDTTEILPVTDDSLMQLGTGENARTAAHAPFFKIPGCSELVKWLLALIPEEDRHSEGTWGVHTFRSFSNVVDGPHQDGFEYGGVYVLDLIGTGARSYLRRINGGQELDYQLQPGQILLFKDSEFLHGATALEGNPCRRDALVIQFDAPEDVEAAKRGFLL